MRGQPPEVLFPGGSPADFHIEAVERLREVLASHGISCDSFRLSQGAKQAYWTSFDFQGDEYLLAVYGDEINLTQGPNVFECYMPEEFKSESSSSPLTEQAIFSTVGLKCQGRKGTFADQEYSDGRRDSA